MTYIRENLGTTTDDDNNESENLLMNLIPTGKSKFKLKVKNLQFVFSCSNAAKLEVGVKIKIL